MSTPEVIMFKALNRLGKWRKIFAGWQLGTRDDKDPEAAALRDHREATLILRAEVTALTNLLITTGVLKEQELQIAVAEEADHLSKQLEKLFPGFRAVDDGIVMDPRAAETTKGWKP